MSFFDELKRRNVVRVAAAYLVISWLLLQVADVLFEALAVPEIIEADPAEGAQLPAGDELYRSQPGME